LLALRPLKSLFRSAATAALKVAWLVTGALVKSLP
jgi:hypothetical protein